MTDSPRFLVAKYIPDPRKMEPRNIGVVLWANGDITSRFYGDTEELTVPVVRPKFIEPKNFRVYKEWVSYWRQLITGDSLRMGPKKVPKASPQFLEALSKTSKDKFVLVEGGIFPVPVEKKDLPMVVEELFDQLVGEPTTSEETEAKRLRVNTTKFISATGLSENPTFTTGYPITYKFRNVHRHVRFSFGLAKSTPGEEGFGLPSALFQTARLNDPKDVNNALFLLEGVAGQNGHSVLSKNQCYAVIHKEAAKDAPNLNESIDSLAEVGTILDVGDLPFAVAEFLKSHLTGDSSKNGDGNGQSKHT